MITGKHRHLACRHSRESGNLESTTQGWIPALAGMTIWSVVTGGKNLMQFSAQLLTQHINRHCATLGINAPERPTVAGGQVLNMCADLMD